MARSARGMSIPQILLLFFAGVVFATCDKSTLNLGGEWSLRDADGTYNLKATVPGGVYSDLMDNGVIGDVFSGYNDVETRWVSEKNWTYFTQFTVGDNLCDHHVINLIFDGVDTFSDIYLNGIHVGSTENMFVQYVFDVKALLQLGLNDLEIRFFSAVEKARLLYERQSLKYEIPPKCVPIEYNGECHANHVRKMQASFSWDWGPAFPSVGIWKPLKLEGYDYTSIRYVTVDIRENNFTESWSLTTTVYFFTPPSNINVMKGKLIISLQTDFGKVQQAFPVKVFANRNGEYTFSSSFSISMLQVSLWWPNGYGRPNLYHMKVTFAGDYGDISIKRLKIGFRMINLVQDKLRVGNSFYLIINGVPIFSKGSNIIPLNVLPEKGQDPATIRFLLQSAKDAHMNMLRVWGGGVYESDLFYEIADELGIMIWQDFMFACSMYPASQDFLRIVRQEVRHQVRRLQYHPSIVLWAGNNENEAALSQNWYNTGDNFEQYKKDYVKLYVNTIRAETYANDISRPFVVSSPTNAVASEREGYIAADPQNQFYGDVHYYNYVVDPWLQDAYPTSRFASEYGLQSYPSISTMLTATNNISDLKYRSAFLEHRQHHPDGDEQIKLLIRRQLDLPDDKSENFFKAYAFYSQIIQAVGIKRQTETYRSHRSNTDSSGRGLTMGALYWQLNDVWVAPTWSGIDFKNNWKMLHYYARNFFSPIMITSYQGVDGTVNLYVVSDLLTNSYNNTATISVYRWSSLDVFYEETLTVNVLAGFSQKIKSFWIAQYLSDIFCGNMVRGIYSCFFYLSLKDAKGNRIAPDNYIFPTALKAANLTKASVKVDSISPIDLNGTLFEVNVRTDAIALFVWLESGNIRGTFSDNGFVQVVAVKTIKFRAESATTVDVLKYAISVTHLKDAQYL